MSDTKKPTFNADAAEEYFSDLLVYYRNTANDIFRRDNDGRHASEHIYSAEYQKYVGMQIAMREVLEYFSKYDLEDWQEILGDNYDLDRLREMVEADREKRCAILKQPMKPLVYKPLGSDVYCPNCDYDLSGGWELSEPDDELRMFQCPRCGQSIDVTKAGPLREIDGDFIRRRFERIV